MCGNCLRVRTAALLGLSAFPLLVSTRDARAQNCNTSITDTISFDEHCFRIGDSVHFSVHLVADDTVCLLDGGTNWVIVPDGTVHTIVLNYAKLACGSGSALIIDCPGSPGCVSDIPTETGPSGFLRFVYGPIQPADVGRALPLFTTPRGSEFTAQLGLPLSEKISAGTISDARTTDCNDPSQHSKTSAQGASHATVETGNPDLARIDDLRVEGTNVVFDFLMYSTRSYVVQFTDSLSPTNWHTLTKLPGDCTIATIRDSITNAQRFYRLVVL